MVYKLYECCKVVKGFKCALLIDIQRKTYYVIPVEYTQFITDNGCVVRQKKLSNKSYSYLIEFLKSEELIFSCADSLLDNFRKHDSNWQYPAHITNAIIELMSMNDHLIDDYLKQLIYLNCMYFEFRIINSCSFDVLKRFIDYMHTFDICSYGLNISVEIGERAIEDFVLILQSDIKIFRTNIFNFEHKDHKVISNTGNFGNIFFNKSSYHPMCCGIVNPDYFTINIEHITESQQHNTCLNRKIAIDAEGNIKNCPSMTKSYGNIKDTKLVDVVNNPEFQKLWYVHKDQIAVCKDCEFRHICTDCRAYLENPEDIYSKPLKCGYNPYTCEWEEWSTNPLKQQAMNYYKLNKLDG